MGVKLKSIYDHALEGISSGLITSKELKEIIKSDLKELEEKESSIKSKDIMDPVKAYNIGKLAGQIKYIKKAIALLSKLR